MVLLDVLSNEDDASFNHASVSFLSVGDVFSILSIRSQRKEKRRRACEREQVARVCVDAFRSTLRSLSVSISHVDRYHPNWNPRENKIKNKIQTTEKRDVGGCAHSSSSSS